MSEANSQTLFPQDLENCTSSTEPQICKCVCLSSQIRCLIILLKYIKIQWGKRNPGTTGILFHRRKCCKERGNYVLCCVFQLFLICTLHTKLSQCFSERIKAKFSACLCNACRPPQWICLSQNTKAYQGHCSILANEQMFRFKSL